MEPSRGNISHYRLIEKIGEGGMGVVWKAEDTILGRVVAIKVLPADMSQDEKRRAMFLAEARLASAVHHANVVQIHEFGHEGDLDFIVMECVEGTPLSKVLHGRPLSWGKVASIGHQLADALASAHKKNLLHRDLKPSNVLITSEGEVKVVDFGLAILFRRDDVSRLTEAPTEMAIATGGGTLAGTLHYMSPEQITGEKLDARSDIFSLGVVLYEMTTGRLPFEGANTADLLREILQATPLEVHDLVPKVPMELGRIIHKALARDRAERYQTMSDLAVDLKHLGRELDTGSARTREMVRLHPSPPRWRRSRALPIAAAAAALFAIAGIALWKLGLGMRSAADDRTLGIIPFEVRGRSDDASYAGLAVAEALVVNLADAHGIKVLPVLRALPNAGSAAAFAAARDEGAGRLLSGSLTWQGTEVLVRMTLVATSDRRVLWGTQESAPESAIASVATRLAASARQALGIAPLKRYEHSADVLGGPEMASSELLSAAVAADRRDDDAGLAEATAKLVQRFPRDLDAWAMRSMANSLAYHADPTPDHLHALQEALASLDRIDPQNPYAPGWRAWLLSQAGHPRDAIDAFSRVVDRPDLSPRMLAWALRRRGECFSRVGNSRAALADLERSRGLDPANGYTLGEIAETLRHEGNTEEALIQNRQALALAPGHWYAWAGLGMNLSALGRHDEAIAAGRKACAIAPNQQACMGLALLMRKAGRLDEAASEAERASRLTPSRNGQYNLACYRALSGDRAGALDALRTAMSLGLADLSTRSEPDLAALRGSPEFASMLAEIDRRVGGN